MTERKMSNWAKTVVLSGMKDGEPRTVNEIITSLWDESPHRHYHETAGHVHIAPPGKQRGKKRIPTRGELATFLARHPSIQKVSPGRGGRTAMPTIYQWIEV